LPTLGRYNIEKQSHTAEFGLAFDSELQQFKSLMILPKMDITEWLKREMVSFGGNYPHDNMV
jgi:hypothetical protein